MKKHFFTFGNGCVHSVSGKTFDKDVIVMIEDEDPRKFMLEYFGTDWGFEYYDYESLSPRKWWVKYEIYDLKNRKVLETNETPVYSW